jgi:hypothetical protein
MSNREATAQGRAKLRLSRGFPRRPACDVTPINQSFESIAMCVAFGINPRHTHTPTRLP